MASDAEMRRIILHAADQLRDTPDLDGAVDAIAGATAHTVRRAMSGPLLAHTAATVYAEAVLRMVATCLADNDTTDTARAGA